MRRENIGIVPVVDQGDRLRGALTDRDLALRVVAVDQPHRSTLVEGGHDQRPRDRHARRSRFTTC